MSSMLTHVLREANDVLDTLIEDNRVSQEQYLHRLGLLLENVRDLERYGDVELTVKGRTS